MTRECKWKPPITKKTGESTSTLKFPCRYPNERLTAELCTQCMLGELYALNFTMASGYQKGAAMQEEMYTFLKTITGDGSLDDLK